MTIAAPVSPVTIRTYENSDYEAVVALFTRINRELAPPDMRERFEEYIATSINGELSHLRDIFSESKRNAFWVVEMDAQVIGMFGIESRSEDSTELRPHVPRSSLSRPWHCAAHAAVCRRSSRGSRVLGFSKLILSTAEIQEAALAFYRKSGYQLVRTELADTMSTKTVGGGITRFHLEKTL
jgi:hypothetical protein